MSKLSDIIKAKRPARWLWRRPRASRRKRWPVRVIQSAVVAAIAALACLVVGEFVVRITMHAPLWEWRDFRHDRAAATINHLVQYDSLLGWRLKPFLTVNGFHTLDYGFRSNGLANAKVEPGGVLAIGSSFTAGSGVRDSETWPAQLQDLFGWNVNNAGQGGYQADQIILFAEDLLPLIRPQVLVVDLIPDTIIGTGYASYGWPKPYFTIENGGLVAHNNPVPRIEGARREGFDAKHFFGHFGLVNKFMAAFFPDFWFRSDANDFVTVSTDEIAVTCRLLQSLKQKADAARTRLVLYLQYSAAEVVQGSRMATGGKLYNLQRRIKDKLLPLILNLPPGAPVWHQASSQVSQCARNFGITVVDELPVLRAVYESNADQLRKYYQIEPDGTMGHKTPLGNQEVAKLVAAAIGSLVPDQR